MHKCYEICAATSYATLGPVEDAMGVPNSRQSVTFTLRDRDGYPIVGLHAVDLLTNFTSEEGHEGTLSDRVLAIDGVVTFTVTQVNVGIPDNTHAGAYTFRVGCLTADGAIISEPFTIPES